MLGGLAAKKGIESQCYVHRRIADLYTWNSVLAVHSYFGVGLGWVGFLAVGGGLWLKKRLWFWWACGEVDYVGGRWNAWGYGYYGEGLCCKLCFLRVFVAL